MAFTYLEDEPTISKEGSSGTSTMCPTFQVDQNHAGKHGDTKYRVAKLQSIRFLREDNFFKKKS